MNKTRVMLADDHGILRAGLVALIDKQPDMEVVGEASDSREALDRARELTPDVLILDLNLPGMGGMRVLEKLGKEGSPIRVLVLTMHDDPAYLHAAQALGCRGYVSKGDAPTELLEGIRAVREGRSFVGRRLAGSQVLVQPAPERPPAEQLSARERQVLQLLAQGYSYQRIAEDLFLSVKTIETYRTRIGQKLGFRSRADLVRYALETGLIGPSRQAESAAI